MPFNAELGVLAGTSNASSSGMKLSLGPWLAVFMTGTTSATAELSTPGDDALLYESTLENPAIPSCS